MRPALPDRDQLGATPSGPYCSAASARSSPVPGLGAYAPHTAWFAVMLNLPQFAAALRALIPRLQDAAPEAEAVRSHLDDLVLPDLPRGRTADVSAALAEARGALQGYLQEPEGTMARPLLVRARNALERAAQHVPLDRPVPAR